MIGGFRVDAAMIGAMDRRPGDLRVRPRLRGGRRRRRHPRGHPGHERRAHLPPRGRQPRGGADPGAEPEARPVRPGDAAGRVGPSRRPADHAARRRDGRTRGPGRDRPGAGAAPPAVRASRDRLRSARRGARAAGARRADGRRPPRPPRRVGLGVGPGPAQCRDPAPPGRARVPGDEADGVPRQLLPRRRRRRGRPHARSRGRAGSPAPAWTSSSRSPPIPRTPCCASRTSSPRPTPPASRPSRPRCRRASRAGRPRPSSAASGRTASSTPPSTGASARRAGSRDDRPRGGADDLVPLLGQRRHARRP